MSRNVWAFMENYFILKCLAMKGNASSILMHLKIILKPNRVWIKVRFEKFGVCNKKFKKPHYSQQPRIFQCI